MAETNRYQHERLHDATKEIRLIQILPGDKTAPVSIILEPYSRAEAPSYSAISYTWGDVKQSKQVLANGEIMDVTENCWYALGQLRLLDLAEYYWIDQLCIDQADLVEKSAQVNLMGAIYRNSAVVLVSLGRHTKETAYFFSQLSSNVVSWSELDVNYHDRVDDWLKNMELSTLERLVSAFAAVGRLSYWHRLWTVQEFALPEKLMVLCGIRCLEWETIASFESRLCKLLCLNQDYYRGQPFFSYDEQTILNLPMCRNQSIRSRVREALPSLAGFDDIILQLGMRNCINVKDRIFGLLSLVGWPTNNSRLLADYSMSKVDIAVKVLQRTSPQSNVVLACRLVQMLELTAADPEMTAILGEKPLQSQSVPREWSLTRASGNFPECTAFLRIQNNEFANQSTYWKTMEFQWPQEKNQGEIDRSFFPRHMKVLVCAQAQPGDVVVRLGIPSRTFRVLLGHQQHIAWDAINQIYGRSGLVVREADEDLYEIVGHAYFFNSTVPPGWYTRSAFHEFDLYLDKKDLLFWTWQLCHLEHLKADQSDYESALDRLATRFCRHPWSSFAVPLTISAVPWRRGLNY